MTGTPNLADSWIFNAKFTLMFEQNKETNILTLLTRIRMTFIFRWTHMKANLSPNDYTNDAAH